MSIVNNKSSIVLLESLSNYERSCVKVHTDKLESYMAKILSLKEKVKELEEKEEREKKEEEEREKREKEEKEEREKEEKEDYRTCAQKKWNDEVAEVMKEFPEMSIKEASVVASDRRHNLVIAILTAYPEAKALEESTGLLTGIGMDVIKVMRRVLKYLDDTSGI